MRIRLLSAVVRLRATTGVAGLALLAALVPAWLAPAQTSTIPFEEDDRLATRYGPVILAKAEAASPPRWRVTFDGRTLLETEFDELGLWEVFEGADDRDQVVVRRGSGGIACPYKFRVIELRAKDAVIVSGEFGSCLDPRKTRLYGDAVVLEMPSHVPHPELLTQRELRERRQTTQIFTVRGGRITMREEIRR